MRRLRAAIRHMHHFYTGDMRQRCRRNMLAGADTAGGIGEFAGIGARVIDQLAQILLRQIFARYQRVAVTRHHAHRHKIVERIIGQLFVETDVGGNVA